ncbi:ABC transporter permease [Lachnospiraceae bacterium]|jgi:ABC-type transport system involved in multi-copper enzyme maturation permease subunit|nr:ABC transporter permease [Lachnospiraceae bacterium]
MLKLIRLEWKKNNIIKYVRNVFIMVFVLLSLILATAGELASKEVGTAYGKSMLKAGVEMFTNMSFIVFTSTMLASFIVGAYKNKTMNLMFSYPINRKKILLCQMLAVWIFNFTALVLTKILFYAVLATVRGFADMAASGIVLNSGMFYAEIFVNSAVMVSVSFIALLAGLKMKSSKAAIIAGVIIVILTQGNIGQYTLADNVPFLMILMFLSAVSVFLSLYRLETRDVL